MARARRASDRVGLRGLPARRRQIQHAQLNGYLAVLVSAGTLRGGGAKGSYVLVGVVASIVADGAAAGGRTCAEGN